MPGTCREPVARLTALLAALCAACGEGPGAARTGTYERLVLRPAASRPESSPRIVLALEVGAGTGGWKVDALRSEREAMEFRGAEQDALRVTGRNPVVEIPIGPEVPPFNQVILHLSVAGPQTLDVEAFGPGGEIVRGAAQRLRRRGEPLAVVFELVGMRRMPRIDGIRITSPSKWADFSLVSVDLVQRPWAECVPAPDRPALVEVGREGRVGVGLASDSPLEARLRTARGRLVFSYSESTLFRPEDRATLKLTLSAAGGTAFERELPIGGDGPPHWSEAAVSLAGLGDGEVLVRFELLTESADPAFCLLGEPAVARPGTEDRTVVLVTSDTHRADHVGVAGSGVDIETPFLDELARRGVYFADCVSAANVTKPSHVSLMTGVHPLDTGVADNITGLGAEAPTLAEAFRAAGYVTLAAVSASNLRDRNSGLGQGFDRMTAPQDRPQRDSSATVADVVRWLDDFDGLPVFVWLHSFDAHKPYDPGQEYARLYYPSDKDPYDPSLPEVPWQARPDWDPDVRDLDWVVARYKGEVTYLDERLAQLYAVPRVRAGIFGLTADHGESLGAHGVFFDHRELYPDTIRVPLILAFPGAPAGTRVERPVHNIDLGRTLLDLAGLEDAPFPGENLLDAIDSTEPLGPRFAVSSGAYSCSVVLGEWFLVLHLRERRERPNHPGPFTERHAVQLFHLAGDPGCEHDLVHERPAEARRLRGVLVDWLLAANPTTWSDDSRADDEQLLADLAQLGYATDDRARSSREWFDPQCTCEWCTRFQ